MKAASPFRQSRAPRRPARPKSGPTVAPVVRTPSADTPQQAVATPSEVWGPNDVLSLQQAIGNQAVQRTLERSTPRATSPQSRPQSTIASIVPAAVILRAATDPVTAVRQPITLPSSVGRSGANSVNGVRTVQSRLRELNYLAQADFERESPAPTATGTVPQASLAATIVAIETLQREVLGVTNPTGRVNSPSQTLDALNRAIARPTAAEFDAVRNARGGITETVVQGVAITGAVGNVPAASVTAGTANRPADVRAVQTRLVQLGHLAANHGESPAETVTTSVAASSLTRTRAAITRFQTREVNYWRTRGSVTGTVTTGVVSPNDATHQLLTSIANYREQFSSGEDISFKDHVQSPYTENAGGVQVGGTARPQSAPETVFTAMGLTTQQTHALQYVSSHEGNFDALNTYDRARVSFGFIQFAGGRGLPPMLALLKSRQPAIFTQMFQAYGIDVEFNVVRGQIANATVVVFDPDAQRVLRGPTAEEAIRDNKKLSAIFIRAGRNTQVQETQVEAATRDYVTNSLNAQATYQADLVEVLAAPGGAVTATHVGAAARTFRASPAYQTLRAANRIRERQTQSSATLGTLLNSEQGLATLMDRAIQEGAGPGGGGVVRLQGALRWVADQRGLADITQVAGYEQQVLQQVVDDLTADIDIATQLGAAIQSLAALKAATQVATATVASVLAAAAANTARTQVDAAITALPRKSFTPARTRLEHATTGLPPQRTALDFAPVPQTVPALRTLIGTISTRLGQLKPNTVNASTFRQRVQSILGSTLAAPPQPQNH
jgi:hypothetical protein